MSESSHTRRVDRIGEHNSAFIKNRKRILMSQDFCAICGKLVDKSLGQYDPWSAQVDHIIPIAKGGHPSSMDNLQLTHRICNAQKGSRLTNANSEKRDTKSLNWSMNWFDYRI